MTDAKKIAKELVEKFRELERNGELTRMGEILRKAINELYKETRSLPRMFDRKYRLI